MFRRAPDLTHVPTVALPAVKQALRALPGRPAATVDSRPENAYLTGCHGDLRLTVTADLHLVTVAVSVTGAPLIYAHITQDTRVDDAGVLVRHPAEVHTSSNIMTADDAANHADVLRIASRAAAAMNKHAGPVG